MAKTRWCYLDLVVLPAGKTQRLDLADVGNVPVNAGTGQADEHPQRGRTPVGICATTTGSSLTEGSPEYLMGQFHIEMLSQYTGGICELK